MTIFILSRYLLKHLEVDIFNSYYLISMLFRGLTHLKKKYSSDYAKAMYEAWKKNPNDVHEDWNLVFNSPPSEGGIGEMN